MIDNDDDFLSGKQYNQQPGTSAHFEEGTETRTYSGQKKTGDRNSSVKKLAEYLQAQGYHPVLLFGNRFSGKSTLLTSLLGYARSDINSNVSIAIGAPIFPIDSGYGKTVYDEAQIFFEHSVLNYLAGIAAPSTRSEFPFFVLVIFRPANGLPEVKFAFLEGRGEWFMPQRTAVALYPQMQDEVREVLFNFSDPISTIFVAPYTTVDGYKAPGAVDDAAGIVEADLAQLGALKHYERIRCAPHLDRLLLLGTKWDFHARPGALNDAFSRPDPAEVEACFAKKYPHTWPAYKNLNLGKQSFMQYSAGVINGNDVRAVHEKHKDEFYRYPRTVWNHLYEAATSKDGAPGKTLYPDVVPAPPAPPVKTSTIDKLMKMLGAA